MKTPKPAAPVKVKGPVLLNAIRKPRTEKRYGSGAGDWGFSDIGGRGVGSISGWTAIGASRGIRDAPVGTPDPTGLVWRGRNRVGGPSAAERRVQLGKSGPAAAQAYRFFENRGGPIVPSLLPLSASQVGCRFRPSLDFQRVGLREISHVRPRTRIWSWSTPVIKRFMVSRTKAVLQSANRTAAEVVQGFVLDLERDHRHDRDCRTKISSRGRGMPAECRASEESGRPRGVVTACRRLDEAYTRGGSELHLAKPARAQRRFDTPLMRFYSRLR